MTSEIIQHQPAELVAEMDYARAISGGAILPAAYRGKPADILIATGLGKAIGIAPAQSLYEIYVVNGRPSPSANLMAALVRRAGHLIRIEGNERTCTATLVRKDDPEYPFSATWTIEQAHAAKLTGKDTWNAYPAAMLRARAISEVVRMGASECVLGMDYSAEEMRDVERATAPAPTFVPAAPQFMPAEPVAEQPLEGEVVDAETGEAITDKTRRRMFALLTKAGETDPDAQRAGMSNILGREVTSRSDLTEAEALAVCASLQTFVDSLDAEAGA